MAKCYKLIREIRANPQGNIGYFAFFWL